MDYLALTAELTADPLGIGYAAMKDAQAAAALNAPTRPTVVEHFVNAKEVLAVLGAVAGAAFLDALDAVAVDNSAVRWAMTFIRSDSGIDAGNAETRAMLDQLATAGVLDAASVATIKTLAERQISRAEELGLPPVTEGDVQFARGGN